MHLQTRWIAIDIRYIKSKIFNVDSFLVWLKSINYSNQRNLSYTLSKNLATLGKGNIEIADKDNSDDLDRLIRFTSYD